MDIVSIILIAMMIEAIINVIKPIWDKTAKQLTAPELISMGLGIVIAIIAKLDLLSGMVVTDNTILLYVFYVLTGVALGRGPSFLYDLWLKLKSGYGNGL